MELIAAADIVAGPEVRAPVAVGKPGAVAVEVTSFRVG